MYGLLATLVFSGLSQAATVFLNPQDSLPSRLSPQQANLVIAAHLGLEQFEVVDQPGRLNHLFREREFVAQGDQSALLLLVDEVYARGRSHLRRPPNVHSSWVRRRPINVQPIVLFLRIAIRFIVKFSQDMQSACFARIHACRRRAFHPDARRPSYAGHLFCPHTSKRSVSG